MIGLVPFDRIPITVPDIISTLATPGLLLLHVPPDMASANTIDAPVHTFEEPVIAEGVGFTIKGVVVLHPVAGMVNVIVVVPARMPPALTAVPVEPTVATSVLLLLHTPPEVASPNGVVKPVQTGAAPVIPKGDRLTVTGNVAEHPDGKV